MECIKGMIGGTTQQTPLCMRSKLFRRALISGNGRWDSGSSPFGSPSLSGHVRWTRCYYCNEYIKVARATMAHIIAECQGGTDSLDNLALACDLCNQEDSKRYN